MADPNLHQLRIFETVVRLGSFSRAAKELNISQPAVSVQVQELERAYGAPLLQRLGRRHELTEAGETVLTYAREIFQLVDALDTAISELRGYQRGTIKVGASATLADYVLPPILAQFQAEFENVGVRLSVASPEAVLERVLTGEVNLGFAAEPPHDPQVVATPFGQDDLVVIAPASHRFAGRRGIPAAALRSERWILREPGSETRLIIDKIISMRGIELPVSLEASSSDSLKRAVVAGLGLGLISRLAVTYEVAAGALTVLDVPELVIRRTLAVMHHRQAKLNRAETSLVALARSRGSELLRALAATG